MAGLDNRTNQTRHADPMTAHMDRHPDALIIHHIGAHRFRIFGSKIKNLPNFYTATAATALFGQSVKEAGIMGFIGARIGGGPFLYDSGTFLPVIIIHRAIAQSQI